MRQPESLPIISDASAVIEACRLAFDIDGVVADTMRLFLDICRDEYHIADLKYEDITDWDLSDNLHLEAEIVDDVITRILDGNYRNSLLPLDGSVQVLNKIGQHCGSLLMVTARPHPGPIEQWFHQQLAIDPQDIDIVCTGSFDAKVAVLKEHGMTYFVEDRLDTCFILDEAGLFPVLFRQPWNRQQHPFVEVGSWQELDALIAY